MGDRVFKDRLSAEFATLGKALANGHRLELLDLLAQGARPVAELAHEAGFSLANTSAHRGLPEMAGRGLPRGEGSRHLIGRLVVRRRHRRQE